MKTYIYKGFTIEHKERGRYVVNDGASFWWSIESSMAKVKKAINERLAKC